MDTNHTTSTDQMYIDVLDQRRAHILTKGKGQGQEQQTITCGKASLAGSVSQRACVFCGSRVVLYPVSDALHLVHGPIGCASYTWDIRGSLSSDRELHRLSFSTDLQEKDVIYGGEKKLAASLEELICLHRPAATFVYATCIVGLIGDDVEAVCRKASQTHQIPVIPVHAAGFSGTKMTGYNVACNALAQIIKTSEPAPRLPHSINIIGEFNLAGEAWIIRRYYEEMGVKVLCTMTGDCKIKELQQCHQASLNVVQCSGSMLEVARMMEHEFDIPYLRVSYFGIEDLADALYNVADHFSDPQILAQTRKLVQRETTQVMEQLDRYRDALRGKKAAVYTGGAFKAFSLVRSLRTLGVKTVIAGSQTGNREDYELLNELCDDGCILIDDTNPLELSKFIQETGADLLIGGVKERPIAFKLGIAFCDHNHERKQPLAGFEGMLNLAKEIYGSVCSPVWKLVHSSIGGV